MYGTHHKTGKKIRLLQHASTTWRDKKTLVWLTQNDDLTIPWNRYDVGVVGSGTYEAIKGAIKPDILIAQANDVEWIRTNHSKVKIIIASKAVLDQIGLDFFQEHKVSNILCLDELHLIYTYLEPWDGTENDACILTSLVLRFGITFPLEKGTRNIFNLKVEAQKTEPQKLYFITQYYRSKTKRTKEIDFCLQKNIANPFIDKIILLNEEAYDLKDKGEKLEQIIIKKRLYYDDVIKYIAALPEDVLIVFANADIFLDSSARYLWSTTIDDKFFALLRYDYINGKSQIFGPRADSQDTWVISSKSVKSRVWKYEDLHFSFGMSGCDNAITLEMLRMKFLVVNPALSIITHHVHESEIRTYDKDEIVNKDVYLYIEPTGLQDMEPIINLPVKNIDKVLEFSAFDRPIVCTKAATYCKMLEKEKRYIYSPSESNTFEKRNQPIYKFENVFQTNAGLMYDYDKIYVGPSKLAKNLWSESKLSTLSASVLSTKAYIVPLTSTTIEDYLLYYLPKIILLRKAYGEDGQFWLPKNQAFVDALSLLNFHRPPIVFTDTQLQYVKEAYVWFPSDNAEVGKEEIDALREMLTAQEADSTVVYMDNNYINKTFIQTCENIYGNVKVIYPDTTTDRKIALLQSATTLISYCTPSIWKYLWAMKSGSRFIDIQNEMELNGEIHHLASACGVEHVLHIIPKAITPAIRTKILDSLGDARLPHSPLLLETPLSLPIIYVPSEKTGFFAHAGDSFREVVDMWEERGYIKKVYGTNKNIWLGRVGDTLLYDRPNYDWIKNADADEQFWKKALFGNPKPIGPSSQAWSFWARRPRLVEAMLDTAVEPLEKTNGLVFYGVIENAVQNANRTKHDWATCCDKFVLSKEPLYTQQEYLNRMAKAKYGLCLAGFGRKCHREVECMAFGTVPVCAPEVDMDSYANKPKEGVHYIRVNNPEEALEKLSQISEECWQSMSDACRIWYKENCSVEGIWELTKKLIL